ncbi:MAG: sarcosine oxidase subunit gamma family protein [Jannaschia sp.]
MSDVTVTAMPPLGMVTLRGTPTVLAKAVETVTECALPSQRMAEISGDCAVLWMSPDEFLVTCPYDAAGGIADRLEVALAGEHATVAVVSDARATFVVTGDGSERVLAKLMPVDFAAMAAREVRRTRMAQVPAAIWRAGDGWRVVCFRSVAAYAQGLLENAAA